MCGAMALIFPRAPRFEGAPVFGSALYIIRPLLASNDRANLFDIYLYTLLGQ